ncbi:Biogenesis of lysosome-related organelles complex 1 subunit 1 [Aphelenchoides besseyi]|nr:Biogenesis of lysosome-related organelles complex 1 subunit 1 [Aphelenchoides besseyi]
MPKNKRQSFRNSADLNSIALGATFVRSVIFVARRRLLAISIESTEMIRDHAAKQHIRKEMQEKRKSEAVVAAQTVSRAYQNQKRLDVESKRLEKNAEQLSRVADGWMEMIASFNYALKVGINPLLCSVLFQEIGNVDTWSKAIEKDTAIISQTLEEAHKRKIGTLDSNVPFEPVVGSETPSSS